MLQEMYSVIVLCTTMCDTGKRGTVCISINMNVFLYQIPLKAVQHLHINMYVRQKALKKRVKRKKICTWQSNTNLFGKRSY